MPVDHSRPLRSRPLRFVALRFAPLLFALAAAAAGCGEAAPSDDGAGGAPASGGSGSGGQPASGGSGGSGGGPDAPPRWRVEAVTTWRGDARAAYTIVHDDACLADSQATLAAPALDERGLHVSFGAIAGECDEQWDTLRAFRAAGHEVMSHSFAHPDLRELPFDEAVEEIELARTTLERQLSGLQVEFFIFPFDSFDDELLGYLRDAGYTGARGGERGHNPSDFADDFRLRFDVYGPGYSIYGGQEGSPCADVESGDDWDSTSRECRLHVMNGYVDDVISDGGYGIRELHGVEGDGWEPLPLTEYEEHLDYVRERIDSGELWMETASTVIRYRRAREACPLPRVSGDTLRFGDVPHACRRYATALSFRIAPLGDAATSLQARQAGAPLPVRAEGAGVFLVDADPSAGDVTLSPTE